MLTKLAWALFVLAVFALLSTPWINGSSAAASVGWNGLTVAITAFVVMLVHVASESDDEPVDLGGYR